MQRVTWCVRRLGRAARRLAPPERTVVATDLSTLFEMHQDGESHRRHGYMRECLLPSLGALRRWHSAAGLSFRVGTNCSTSSSAPSAPSLEQKPSSEPSVLSRARSARSPRGVPAIAANLACDAGYLGLVDLVLAAEAAAFVAVDVSRPRRYAPSMGPHPASQPASNSPPNSPPISASVTCRVLVLAVAPWHCPRAQVHSPWRSAYLEWIVQLRRLAGKTRTELIQC